MRPFMRSEDVNWICSNPLLSFPPRCLCSCSALPSGMHLPGETSSAYPALAAAARRKKCQKREGSFWHFCCHAMSAPGSDGPGGAVRFGGRHADFVSCEMALWATRQKRALGSDLAVLHQSAVRKIQVSDLLSGLRIIDQDLHVHISVVDVIQLVFIQILSHAQKVVFLQ